MCSLLFLACIALALPTASRQLYPGAEFSHKDLLSISHGTAVMLVIVCVSSSVERLGSRISSRPSSRDY